MRIKTRFAKIVTRVVMLLGLLVIASPTPGIHAVAAANPVAAENQQPGSSGWQQPNPAADDINGQIKGYASATSVMQNDSLSFYVSVNPAQTYTIDFYRMGWYQGLGGRLRLHVGPLNGVQQPACPIDATTGLIACNWSPGFSLSIPSDWTSGIYLAVLTNAQQTLKTSLGTTFGDMLHEGRYYDPLLSDIRAFLDSSQDHVTAVAAITAVGPAIGHEFLATEVH